jgi:UDP-N-acetylmuramoyl-L-alanyl-D-glutamate--2,6-diaminopimelate ligase
VRVFGITGTNGKTTTTYLLDSILRAAGEKTGVIGTVETRIGDTTVPATRTTPESSDLQALLGTMRDSGVTAVSMEVSSHAIDLHRVDGVHFAAVGITNLTQDHLDYHHTLAEYASVKRRLFTDFSVGGRVIDIDDPFGAQLAEELDDVLTVGRGARAAIRAEHEVRSAEGTEFTLVTPEASARLLFPLAGAYNVSNALMAAGCALAAGIPLDVVVAGLEAAPQVPGRLERVDAGQPFAVLVDYAHTPDSLEKAIQAVQKVTTGRTIVVFGCGGDRDPAKRPLMGAAAGTYADIAIITSDNPRSEDPLSIISQVEPGLAGTPARYEVEPDRRRAIARAVAIALPEDSVLIAGKGHEDYQIFADKTVHFDDREVAREELDTRC